MDAFGYYDQIGAVRYAAQFWARALSKIRWYVGEKDEEGEIHESNDTNAQMLLDRVQDPGGGRTKMLSAYGQLRFLVGECYLLWTEAQDDEEEAWEIVSQLEMRRGSRRAGQVTWQRIAAPGLNPRELLEAPDDAFEPVGKQVRVYRFWRPHPAYSLMADSPMRSVLSDCEEVVRCTHTINARLISRLAGPGIFAIPQSWTVVRRPTPEGTPPRANDPEADPVFAEMQDAMMTAIKTPGSAESVVPIMFRVPDDTTGNAKIYKIWDPNETIRETQLRDEAIKRFAIGVDAPPEVVVGFGDVTHWNAWMIDRDSWEHIAPVAQEFADDLGGVYLRPTAKAEGLDNWQNLVVAYDPSEFLTDPDGFSNAKDMYDRRVVGKDFLRDSGNAKETDAMTDAELEEALFAETHIEVQVENGELKPPETSPPSITPQREHPAPGGAALPDQAPTTGTPPTGKNTQQGPPNNGNVPPADQGLTASAYMILGAAEAAGERLREQAGSRIRNHVQGNCPECLAEIEGIPNALVALTLGETRLKEVGAPDPSLLMENGANFFVGSLVKRGISSTQARAMAELLELHAARTLFDTWPEELPPGFVGRVQKLVEVE
jgi:hypothetical protein